MQHVRGAARLVEARGVESFDSPFEISLFFENIASTVRADANVSQNKNSC